MVNKADKNEARLRRHRRVRGKISGTAERPRLDVFRSAKHIYAQVIDDVAGRDPGQRVQHGQRISSDYGGNVEAAKKVGRRPSPRSAWRRASPRSFTTVAVSSITAALRLSLRVPARAA